jgi:phosphatidylglycerophosphate synthase
MPTNKFPTPKSVIEPNYFSNWGDLWYPRTANILLKLAASIPWLTPNQVTITSFILYTFAVGLIVTGGKLQLLAVILLPISYVLDCLDGQLARYTGRTSPIGDYLDKTLDVLKIGIINLGMGLAAVRLTGHGYYLMLALLSCFGFLFRYYIKLETIFSAVNNDKDYLDKSRSRRWALYAHFDSRKSEISGFREQLLWFWDRHHSMLALDEAEHVTFGALAALVGRPDLWLWLFAVGQIIIALARLVQRGQQLSKLPNSLTYPLRK